MFNIGAVVAHIKADLTDFQNGMNNAKKELSKFTGSLSSIGSGIASFGKQAALFSGIVGGGLLLATKQGVESAAKFEQYQVAFTTLLKDQKKAAEAIKNIQEDAAKTPFELAPLVGANQRLISAGISAKDARKDIINLGNAISATGGGNAELERLSTNLQQIKAVGQASALDIKQFAFAGINVYQLLADATGKNVEQVKDMDVSYELLSQAFEKASQKGGMFEGAMQTQSQTLNGLMSTLRDTFSLALKDILVDSGVFDIVRNAIAQLIPMVDQLAKDLVKFIQDLRANQDVQNFLQQFADILAKIGDWISDNQEVVLTFLKGLGIALGVLLIVGTITALITALMNPLVLVALAIVALYTAWETNFWGIRDITTGAWNTMKKNFEDGLNFLKWIGGLIYDNIVKPFVDAWNKVSELVNKIKDALDFTKRHSPSVVDIVNHGVREVNKALNGLSISPDMNFSSAAGVGTMGSSSMPMLNFNIDLSGAMIADEQSAQRIGEIVGDNIIRRLQANVRL